MQTVEHQNHIKQRVSCNWCQECRADCERQFLRQQWLGYKHVSDYLAWLKPRFAAIKQGNNTADARIWHRDFILALNRRITLKGRAENGRKYCDSYLERLGQFSRNPKDTHYANAAYLRRFAQRGASTLN